MESLDVFVVDLALILSVASIAAVILKKLKQPVVLGYIAAGFLISPNFTMLPTVVSQEDITVWANIGVIFLMFGLGLEFNLKKIAEVGKSAIITAELACGFIIFLLLKHEQAVWIMLTILFIHMAENPRAPLPDLVKRRIAATPIGILLGGAYLAAFGLVNYRASYIVPLTGTLGFFMLYLKNDYFLFTLLFMFTLTVFSDWMLGSYHRFHFTEILFIRSLATVIGGILLLCGKDLMEKEAV
jgi:Kef-type K+ transport system membrane component KefB